MKKLNAINSLRFIFMFLVFIHHFDSFDQYYQARPNDILLRLLFEGFIGVNFFFMLSGFVCSLGYKNRIINNEVSLSNFMSRRIEKIYPLYLITTFIGMFLYNIPLRFLIEKGLPFILLLQSFIPVEGFAFNFNAVSWCLSDQMFFYVVFYKLSKKSMKIVSILTVAILAFILFYMKRVGVEIENPTWLYYVNPVFRSVEFLIGMLLYDVYTGMKDKVSKKIATILEIASIIVLCIWIYGVFRFNISLFWRWSIYYIIPIAFLIFSFSFDKGIISNLISGKTLTFLGSISMEFYLLHKLVIFIILKLFQYNVRDIYAALKIGGISFIVTIIISYMFNKLLDWKRIRECISRSFWVKDA